jgi:hypothetical protein
MARKRGRSATSRKPKAKASAKPSRTPTQKAARAKKKKWSPEYAKRMARAQAKGLSKQAARGHKPKEHVERAAKERAKYGATKAELATVTGWYRNKYNPRAYDEKARVTLDEMLQRVKEKGYASFRRYRRAVDDIGSHYRRDVRRGTYPPGGYIPEGGKMRILFGGGGGGDEDEEELEYDAGDELDFADPDDDGRWYYYK